jgi:hypothetical protein
MILLSSTYTGCILKKFGIFNLAFSFQKECAIFQSKISVDADMYHSQTETNELS